MSLPDNWSNEGYKDHNGRFQKAKYLDLSPSAALTADVDSAVVYVGDKGSLRLTLATTAVSASDTLDVTILGSQDGVTFDTVALATFTQVTSAPDTQLRCCASARYIKASYDVTGSGVSIECTLTGEAI